MTLGMKHLSDSEQIKQSTLAMVFLGAGEIVGGIVNGQVQDRLKSKKIVVTFNIL
jgi:predicted MFS family arabinose efflux permease